MRLFYKSLNLAKHKLLLAACMSVIGISDVSAQITIGFGGPTATASSGFPRPYPENQDAARQQYLFLASELRAAGMLPGIITAVGFYTTGGGLGAASAIQGYSIQMGATSNNSLSNSTWEITSPYFGPAAVTCNANNWTTHSLNSPGVPGFPWDGTSNVVVEICQGNTRTTANPTTTVTTTSFNSSHSSAQTTGGVGCGSTSLTTQGTQTQRPSTQFTFIPNCMPPSNIVTTNIKPYSANVTWTASPIQNTTAFRMYQHFIDQTLAPPAASNPATTPVANPQPINLTAETKYYVHVRTECDVATGKAATQFSPWIVDSFITIPDCLPPTPTIDQITHKDAVASWPPVPTAHDYEYAVSADNTMPPPSKGTMTQNTFAYLPGLMPGKVYTFFVRAYCEPTPISRWAKIDFQALRTTGIDDADNSGFAVLAYPTPVKDMMTVEITNGAKNAKLQIADLSGRHVRAMDIENGKATLDMNGFTPGIYIIKYTDEIRSTMSKIVKE